MTMTERDCDQLERLASASSSQQSYPDFRGGRGIRASYTIEVREAISFCAARAFRKRRSSSAAL
jgi:hypothetical protein